MAFSQDLSADKLVDMLSLSVNKAESQLINNKYVLYSSTENLDTSLKLYASHPVKTGKTKKNADVVSRKFLIYNFDETFKYSYKTSSKIEFSNIIKALKKKGFQCSYEMDSTIRPASYVYQYQDHTAETCIQILDDTTWFTIAFDKKTLPVDKEIIFAEDLLQFTSHEQLVYYFGAKHVKKDVYFFGEKDIASCSVLLMNTDRQVIFVWSDGLNNRNINSLLIGGQHKLKSMTGNEKFIAENKWGLKCGLRAGMPLYDLRSMNKKNISFCGGYAPNPGLVSPESTGNIDFKNKDVILGCVNCDDDLFMGTKSMNADKAMKDGRIFFVLTIVLYPEYPLLAGK